MMTKKSFAASQRSKVKAVMPTFQQLGLTSLPLPKPPSGGEQPAVEVVEEEPIAIVVDDSFKTFPDSANVFHHIVSPSNSDENDIMMLDVTPIPSEGRLESAAGTSRMAQRDTINEDTFTSLAMPLDGLIGGATKELDYVLAGGDDKMSVVASDVTAVTGNVSGFNSRASSYSSSSTTMKKVTSRASPANKDNHRVNFREWVESKGRSDNNIEVKQRDESPEPLRPRRLGMCGAIYVDDELKESIQDVNVTVKQILSVRPFGLDERDAVRETFNDFKTSFRKKVNSALLLPTNCNPGLDREPIEKNNKTRYDKVVKKREEESAVLAVLKARQLEILQQETDLDECEEVSYDKSSQAEPEPTRMLV